MKWLDKLIVSERGLWDNPNEPVVVPTENGNITMKADPKTGKKIEGPVFAIDNTGYSQMMYPGGEYRFPGNMVYEVPMAYGGDISIPDLSRPNWLDKYQGDEGSSQVGRRDPNQPFFPSSTEQGLYEAQYSQPQVNITPNWTEAELERNKLRDKYIADDKKVFRHWYDKLGYDKDNVTKRANQFAYNKLAKQYLRGDKENLTDEQKKFIGKSEYANRLQPSIGSRFAQGITNPGFNLETLGNLAAPFEYPTNLVRGAVKGEFTDALMGQTPSPYFVSSDLAGTSPTEAAIMSGLVDVGVDTGIGAINPTTLSKGVKGAAEQFIGKGKNALSKLIPTPVKIIASRARNKKNSNIIEYDEDHPLDFLGTVETPISETDYAKFIAENPNAKVVNENWGDVFKTDANSFYDMSRAGQQQAFDEATDFGYRWTLKDPKKHDQLMSMVRKIEEDRSTATLESTKKVTTFNDWAKQKGYLDDYGTFNPPSATDPGRSEFMSKWKESKEALEKISLADQMNRDKIIGLHKKLDENVDPSFRKRVENIYSAAESRMPQSAGIQNLVSRDKNKLVHIGEYDSMQNLSDKANKELSERYKNLLGLKFHDTGETITLASKPRSRYKTIEKSPFRYGDEEFIPKDAKPKVVVSNYNSMISPTDIGETAAHEFGHAQQEFWNNWVDVVDEYDPNFGYYTKSKDNPLAKRLSQAMIDPKRRTELDNAKNNEKYNYDTWLGAFRELNSEMQKARYVVAREYMKKHGLTLDEAVTHIKTMEDSGRDDLFDYYLTEGKVNKHFKPTTSQEEKRSILKEFIPAAAPLTIAAGTAAAMKKEKNGGWLDNY